MCKLAVYYLEEDDKSQYALLLHKADEKGSKILDNEVEAKGMSLKNYVWALCKGKRFLEAQEVVEDIKHQASTNDARRILSDSLTDDGQFEISEQNARKIQDEYDRASSLAHIASKKREQGHLGEALDIMHITEHTVWWVNRVVDFADDLLNKGYETEAISLFHHAQLLIQGIDSSENRRSAGNHLLSVYVRRKKFAEFFNSVKSEFVDVFIENVAQRAPVFDELENGLSLRVIAEITRIASWIQPYWEEINREIVLS